MEKEKLRLTASASFLGYRIILDYDGSINNNQTNCNGKLKGFLAFNTPGFLLVGEILLRRFIQQILILLIHIQQDIEFL